MLTKSLLEHKKIVFGLALGWTAVIAFLCLISFNELPSIGVSGADKYVHAAFHFVFTTLWGTYSWAKTSELRIPSIIRIVFISFGYGILIEFLQETFTKTRHADILDVLANFSGAALALLVFLFLKKPKTNKTE